MRFVDKTGMRFGRLVVLKVIKHNPIVWLCQCDCGKRAEVDSNNLTIKKDGSLRQGSCGCEQYKLKVSPAKYIFFDYRQSAKGKGILFELSEELVGALIVQNCFYCGQPPSRSISQSHRRKNVVYDTFRWNGIDRIDSNRGYTQDNVVPCCKTCNEMKSDRSQQEFLEQIRAIYHFQCGERVMSIAA